MCGRYTLHSTADLVASHFDLDEAPEIEARYNIAPTQEAIVVRREPSDVSRRIDRLRWGLVPRWANDSSIGVRCINARCETVAEKRAYGEPLRHQRCLVPADGFYEWASAGRMKQPYHVHRVDHAPFAMAGLWSTWREEDETLLGTFSIVTCPANDRITWLHDRMPVILPPADYDHWLDPEEDDPERLLPLLRPCPADWLETVAVSHRVNAVANDGPELLGPPEQASLFGGGLT